jgi:hypothetical protein
MFKHIKMILPSEHGSWSLMLTPFVIGAGVAVVAVPRVNALAILLCFIAAMALFLARQPLALWVRIRRGRARRSDERAASGWSLLLGGIAALAGTGLILLGRAAVMWLAIPAAAVLAITLAMGAVLGPRRLATELVGVVGLALAAPAAYVAAAGILNFTAGAVWAISALHNVISVLYVRLRIDQRHDRASRSEAVIAVVGHLVSLAAVIGAALAGWLPPLVGLPIAILLARALVVAWHKPPLENVKQFGFTEMGLALAFAAVVVAAYLIAD